MSVPTKRMIHTRIWISKQFNQLSAAERLLFIGMITLGDYHGRLRGDSTYLKREFFYQDKKIGIERVRNMRDRIAEVGLIELYSDENGEYISHPRWKTYQILDRRSAKPSEYPDPPSWKLRENTTGLQGELNGTEPNSSEYIENERKEMERNEIARHVQKSY